MCGYHFFRFISYMFLIYQSAFEYIVTYWRFIKKQVALHTDFCDENEEERKLISLFPLENCGIFFKLIFIRWMDLFE
jgi:hypothetical protein